MVLKTHQFLQPLVNCKCVAKRTSDEDCNLDIFKMTLETSELSKNLVSEN
jgi:hypothetical protein